MGIFSLVLQCLGALAAYLKYRFDPEMIARRDEIHKQLAEESSYDAIDQALAGKDTLSLSYFISEYLRRMRQPQTDNHSGRTADLLLGELPKRSKEDRDKDSTEGLSG